MRASTIISANITLGTVAGLLFSDVTENILCLGNLNIRNLLRDYPHSQTFLDIWASVIEELAKFWKQESKWMKAHTFESWLCLQRYSLLHVISKNAFDKDWSSPVPIV